jgi:DNA transformation protein and related proteins
MVSHALELLAPLGVPRARAMFGGHGLYVDDLFIALVADEVLYLKVDAQTRPVFEAAACQPFVYEGKGQRMEMSFWTVPQEALDASAALAPWAHRAMEAALRARNSRPASRPAPRPAPRPAAKASAKAAPARRARSRSG